MAAYMQGDAVKVEVTDSGLDTENVSGIEFVIGGVKKHYPGEVTYDSENDMFLLPLTQQETMNLIGAVRAQARVKYANGTVRGQDIGYAFFKKSDSKEVI